MDSKYDSLLSKVGLDSKLTWNEKDSYNFPVHLFKWYMPKEYVSSARKEMDEVYRTSELVLLHQNTGLRSKYIATENYQGDEVAYSVIECFVINKENQKFEVEEIDLINNLFLTSQGPLQIESVRKHYLDCD